MRIYHVPGTRSVRPIWLCYELGLEVDVVQIDFAQTFRDAPAWRAISPAGKVPVLTDGDLTMFESGAMVDYILDAYGQGRLRPPAGSPARALHQQWCWFSEATLLRPVGLNRLLRHGSDDIATDAAHKTRECIAVVEGALGGGDFLLGDAFTAADVMMGYALALLENLRVLSPADYPRACAYLDRLKAREAFQRAMGVVAR
ncbi:MAG TPA: glutathione S-transferase family protein [Caulobacteraceae bacterium]|jgi:glutathione S-transferase